MVIIYPLRRNEFIYPISGEEHFNVIKQLPYSLSTYPLLFGIQISLEILIISILIYQRIKYRLTAINLIILIFVSSLLRSVADFLTSNNQNIWNVRYEYHYFFFVIIHLLVYFYFEYIYTDHINPIRLSLVLTPFISFIMFYFLILFQPQVYSHNPTFWYRLMGIRTTAPFYTFPTDLIAFEVWIFGTFVSYRLVVLSPNYRSQRDSLLLLLTSLFSLLASTLELSEHFLDKDFNGNLLSIFPFLTMAILYIRNPYFSYSSPHLINHIRVIDNRSSITYLSVDREESHQELFENLLGPIVMTMESHLQELLRIDGKISQIRIGDKILQILYGDKLQLLIEARCISYAIKDGMKSFLHQLEQSHDLTNQVLEVNEPKIFDMIDKYLPFMLNDRSIVNHLKEVDNKVILTN